MAKITIRYAGTSIEKDVAADTRVRDITADVNIKAVLGFSNVEAQIDGIKQSPESFLGEGDELVLVNIANSKAA